MEKKKPHGLHRPETCCLRCHEDLESEGQVEAMLKTAYYAKSVAIDGLIGVPGDLVEGRRLMLKRRQERFAMRQGAGLWDR